jgi:hypothetical protein
MFLRVTRASFPPGPAGTRDARQSCHRLSAVAGGMLGLFRMRQRHPERVTEATVDQLAEAELRLLGVPADEAARLAALPLPDTGTW